MLCKPEKSCKYFVIRFIMLTSVISICGQQCACGICNMNTYLHIPGNIYSAAVFVSRDSTSFSTLEATILRQNCTYRSSVILYF